MSNEYYIYVYIRDLYSYAECHKRGFNPETKNLVVAKYERSDNTKCFAVTPAMKRLGVVDNSRLCDIPKEIKYVIAEPNMSFYFQYTAAIYEICMRFCSKKDICVCTPYEILINLTGYLNFYNDAPQEAAKCIMKSIEKELRLCPMCGIGTSLYLAKIAVFLRDEFYDDNIYFLNENTYKNNLWKRPMKDFWFVNHEENEKLVVVGIHSMGEIAKADVGLLTELLGRKGKLLYECASDAVPVTLSKLRNNKIRQIDKILFPLIRTKEFIEDMEHTEKIVVPEIKFSFELFEEKNRKLVLLEKGKQVTVTYYSEGEYIRLRGIITEINTMEQRLKIVDRELSFSDIIKIDKL